MFLIFCLVGMCPVVSVFGVEAVILKLYRFENNSFWRHFDYISASSKENVNFRIHSLNVRGIRSPEKRKASFIWLTKQKADIISFKKHTVQKTLKTYGELSGAGKYFFAHR